VCIEPGNEQDRAVLVRCTVKVFDCILQSGKLIARLIQERAPVSISLFSMQHKVHTLNMIIFADEHRECDPHCLTGHCPFI
jgi:hypothetical protein